MALLTPKTLIERVIRFRVVAETQSQELQTSEECRVQSERIIYDELVSPATDGIWGG